MTPLMQQWQRLKAQVGDAWLFFRLGDFYELFQDDATAAAPVLDVQLTSRDGVTPMCGVPHHALDLYVDRALRAGYSVAVAEQLEDPRTQKGLVDRGIVRRVTPGTYVPEQGEPSGPILAMVRHRDGFGAAALWITEGRAEAFQHRGTDWAQVLQRQEEVWGPVECLAPERYPDGPTGLDIVARPELFQPRHARERLLQRLHLVSLTGVGLEDMPWAQEALWAVVAYADETGGRTLQHLTQVGAARLGHRLLLSPGAGRQLGVVHSTEPDLASLVNQAVTPMGRRVLATWIATPLTDRAALDDRFQHVRAWRQATLIRQQFREQLGAVGDVSRVVARLCLGVAHPRDLVRLGHALAAGPALWGLAARAGLPECPRWDAALDEVAARLQDLSDTAGTRWDEGGLIRDGVDPDLDRDRRAASDERTRLLELEQTLRAETGIRGLKVGVHRTLGYFVDIPRRDVDRIPDGWRQRQSMATSVRYTMDRLEALATAVDRAEASQLERDQRGAEAIRDAALEAAPLIQSMAADAARLDALAALAEAAQRGDWVEPTWSEEGLRAVGVRHPVVETTVAGYVPSALDLSPPVRVALITGPNMAGKSTFMRAVAQNVWLQHIGSFVAAESWEGPLLDGLFTRIGADDNLARGQSTFMVEMEETAFLLAHAGPRSLVVLDELGRGTSTFDGLAIAWAVTSHLSRPNGPYTLIATHYRELSAIESPAIRRLKVDAVEEPGGRLVLLHAVQPGVASQSFGVAVAARAGLPRAVVTEADRLLRQWERTGRPTALVPQPQSDWFEPDPVAEELLAELRRLALDDITPLQALGLLHEWQGRLGS